MLTYHNDNNRTAAAIRKQGLRLKYINNLGGMIEGHQEMVSAQVLYAPGLRIQGLFDQEPTLHNAFFVATNKNNLYAWDADTGVFLYGKRFPDWEAPSVRKFAKVGGEGDRSAGTPNT